jgi:hypothetical protein
MRAVPDPPQIWTDFSRSPHEELIRALSVSNPSDVVAAGDAWASAAAALFERAHDIYDRSGTVASGWTGVAADRYRQMMSELLNGISKVATAALEARDLMYATGEALQAAWTGMPAVSGEAARRQAILIMANLAERYLVVTAELNESMSQLLPGAVDPAQIGPGGVSSGPLPPGELVFGNPDGSAPAGGRQPLFGGMLPAGLAAAGAVLGRPFIPSLLRPGRQADPADGTPTEDAAKVPDAPVLDELAGGGMVGGAAALSGGGGIGGGGLLPLPDGGAPAAPDPGAYATGHAHAGGIAAATGGGAAGGGTGGSRGMPMMPMGMMGGDSGGGGRRLPPWLVETEDVWGESTVVTTSVIGEDSTGGEWW